MILFLITIRTLRPFFLCVGSGIAPLISPLKEILYTKPLIKLYLVYENRKFQATLFQTTELIGEKSSVHIYFYLFPY